jgi:3-methyladenine DNA glycosylase AlkD
MAEPKATLAAARKALHKLADPARAARSQAFFKESGAETFIGVPVPVRRKLAAGYRALSLADIGKLLASRIHEERQLGLEILVMQFRKADERGEKQIFDFFLKRRQHLRNWADVDASAPYIVGPYLMNRSKTLLHRLIKSKHIWDRRIALVATWPMIRAGHIDDTLKLAAQVLDDTEDLIHKATGWMLREVGKKDAAALRAFLRKNYARLPRTTLRYAIERFSKAERQRWLKGPE